MKKIVYRKGAYLKAFLAAGLLAGCSSEMIEDTSINLDDGDLIVRVENGHHETRAGFTDDQTNNFFWSKNDLVAVSQPGNELFYKFNLAAGEGTSKGTFVGITHEAKIGNYIVYPYSAAKAILANGELTYSLPARYTYTSVEADFHSAALGRGNSLNPVMAGKIESTASGNSVATLKQLGGVFGVKVNKMPTSEGVFTLIADKGIQGDFTLDLNNKDVVLEATESTGSNNRVSISFSGATEGESAVFYVPVPVAATDYTGLRVELAPKTGGNESNSYFASCGDFHVQPGSIYDLAVENTTPLAQEKKFASASEELKNKQNSNKDVTVAIKDEVKAATIVIPAPDKSSTPAPEQKPVEKKIAMNEVADNAKLTLKEPENEIENKDAQEVTLAIPYKKEEANTKPEASKAPSVDVAMPNSTVKLEASSGVATFNAVTAETMTEKSSDGEVAPEVIGLEINSGVTVNSLKVKSGNISVKSGGEIKDLSLVPSSRAVATKVYLYVEDGAKVPDVLPEGVLKQFVGVAKLKFAILMNLNTTDPYVLNEDLDLRGKHVAVPQGKTFCLDLNGHKLITDNSAAGNLSIKGNFVLSDSKGQGKVSSTTAFSKNFAEGMVTVDGGTFTLQGGTLEAKCANPMDGQVAVKVRNGGSFEMNGGTILAGWSAVEAEADAGTIQLTNGVLEAAQHAVLLLNGGRTVINGGTFTGEVAGVVELNGGELSIADGLFNGSLIVDSAQGGKLQLNGGTFDDPAVLQYAATDKVVVKLKKDYSWKGEQRIRCGVLDLNQHTLMLDKKQQAMIRVEASETGLSIRNGQIRGIHFSPREANMYVAQGAGLSLEEVSMTTDGTAVSAQPGASAVLISNSVLTAPVRVAEVKMTAADKESQVNLTVSQSTLTGKSPLMYWAQGKLTLDHAVINANAQGVIAYGGLITLESSCINMDYSKLSEEDKNNYRYYENANWGEGDKIPAGGLVIGSKRQFDVNLTTQGKILNKLEIKNLSPEITDFGAVLVHGVISARKVECSLDPAMVHYYGKPRFIGRYIWVNGKNADPDLSAGGEGMDGMPAQPSYGM